MARNPLPVALRRSVAAAALLLTGARPAAAGDCTEGAYSPCLDADARWLAPPNADFVGLSPARGLGARRLGFGVAFGWSERPLVLTLPGPDPTGREVRVVERVVAASPLVSIGLTDRTTLDLAVPLTIAQPGTGIEALTSLEERSRPPLLRDPRLGTTITLSPSGRAYSPALAARYVLLVPGGGRSSLAGERAAVGAPSLLLAVESRRWVFGSELGARLRLPTRLGDARSGTSLVAQLGVGWRVLDGERLLVGVEAIATPVLVTQPTSRDNARRVPVTPAEWLATIRVAPLGAKGPRLALAFGTGIAWPGAAQDGGTAPQTAMTTPRFRGIVAMVQELDGPRTSKRRP